MLDVWSRYRVSVVGGIDHECFALARLARNGLSRSSQVLAVLNRMFLAEDYGKFYTIWYGVYRPSDRQLFWAGGGHPEPLLFDPQAGANAIRLESEGPLMGVMDCDDFGNGQITRFARFAVYLYRWSSRDPQA